MSQPVSGASLAQAASSAPTWHVLGTGEAVQFLGVDPQAGLELQDARTRTRLHGPNRLAEKPPRSPWILFFGQFKNVLILVLILAAALAASIGKLTDAAVILTVVLLNAALGFYQEYRAEQSLAALKKMLPSKARVRREGNTHELSAERLVPGDIVLLDAGDRVPADGRLIATFSLEINESTLTGESLPVGKQVAALSNPDTPLAERLNMAYMNTMVTRGRAEMLVTATGMLTEMGKLSLQLASVDEGPARYNSSSTNSANAWQSSPARSWGCCSYSSFCGAKLSPKSYWIPLPSGWRPCRKDCPRW